MEVEVISTMITTVGFPIAVTIFLLYERMTDRKLQTKELADQQKLTRTTIEQNTAATKELCIMIKERMK